MFLSKKIVIILSTLSLQVSAEGYSYAQAKKVNYGKIQNLYSTKYSNLRKMYVSFFYPPDQENKSEFLIDVKEKTDDEKFMVKEPLGYDIKLTEKEHDNKVNIGGINLEKKEKVDE